jgi:hypothetical protein
VNGFSLRLVKRLPIILIALCAAVLAAVFHHHWRGKRFSGPLRHEAYIWQRAWSQPVRDAVSQHGTNFARLVPLKAEISWKDGKPQVARVAVDYATLREAKVGVGIALRIGPHPGPFEPRGAVTDFICDLAATIVNDARSNSIPLSELQLDFDCAESKLDGYRVWVEAVQRRVSPLPVTITTLPSWLNSEAFRRLAAVATNYVLQVHSVERPRDPQNLSPLCDPWLARRAVERAGRIGVPFRVALPTYGYVFAFDDAGGFIGLSAEGPRPNWPTNTVTREVSSNPEELAALVGGWTASRPAALRGVIWYRLPVATDSRNWRWPTLRAVMNGRAAD